LLTYYDFLTLAEVRFFFFLVEPLKTLESLGNLTPFPWLPLFPGLNPAIFIPFVKKGGRNPQYTYDVTLKSRKMISASILIPDTAVEVRVTVIVPEVIDLSEWRPVSAPNAWKLTYCTISTFAGKVIVNVAADVTNALVVRNDFKPLFDVPVIAPAFSTN